MLYKAAYDIAFTIVGEIQPLCDRVHIAGSVRRKKPQVGDIEIVCQVPHNLRTRLGLTLRQFGEHRSGQYSGRYCKLWLTQNIQLDLFMPQSDDYYRQLAIRTGSAEYSHKVLAAAWTRLGWVGTEDGLRRREQCQQKSGKWQCVASPGDIIKPPVWTSEEDFFNFLNIVYLDPQHRGL